MEGNTFYKYPQKESARSSSVPSSKLNSFKTLHVRKSGLTRVLAIELRSFNLPLTDLINVSNYCAIVEAFSVVQDLRAVNVKEGRPN